MGETAQRPSCTEYDFVLQGTLFGSTPSKQIPEASANVQGEISVIVDTEIQTPLEKGAIKTIDSSQDKYLSSIFLVEKKDSSQRPIINLKNLNQHIPYEYFKMDGLYLLKGLLKEGDFLCKVDLKDAYFVFPLPEESQNFVCFEWKEKLYQFVCLFQLGSSSSSFHKVDKNSNSCHKEVEWEDYNISRRHLDNGRVQGRVIDTKRYSHFSPPELGLCHQPQEVC